MHLIDSQNASENNEWVAGDPTTGTPPTSGTAAWFNAIQFEIANYIASQGMSLNKNDNNQLKAAIANHLNQSISSALSGLELGDTGPGYTHPDVHPAQMITESSLKRFVTDAQINAWNSKANESHLHNALAIAQDSTHRFVTDDEKQSWNKGATGVKWDSGWFAVELGQSYTKIHNLGEIPLGARLILKSSAGSIVMGNVLIQNTDGHFFGTTIQDLTDTQVKISTGNAALWHSAAGIGGHFSSGFARIIL